MIILSILCATTPDRAPMFDLLHGELLKQIYYMHHIHTSLGEIEIVIDDSKRFLDGGLSIGKKREALVQRATGRYLCFLDSDETIAPNYVETLVRLCCEEKDVCTFRAIAKLDNYWTLIDMSLMNSENQESTPYGIVYRNAWHVCPVRSEFAKRYSFEDVSYGEDALWMNKVLQNCKTEAHVDLILLQYNHSTFTSEADKITRHELDNQNIRA